MTSQGGGPHGGGVTELYRRGVLLPSNHAAAARVSQGWVESASDVSHWVELSETVFNVWVSAGLFEDINAAAGTLLDDYEAETIPSSKLGLTASAMATHLQKFDADAGIAARAVLDMCKEAERKSLPLVWVL